MIKYFTVFLIAGCLFMAGCAKGGSGSDNSNMKADIESSMEKSSDAANDMNSAENGTDVKNETLEALHLGNSLYLIIRDKGEPFVSDVIYIDTQDTQVKLGAMISCEVAQISTSLPPQATASDVKVLDKTTKGLRISPNTAEFIAETLGENTALVDVREEDEYNDGHIRGADLIPLGTVEYAVPEKYEKDKLIMVYCRSGNRSSKAQEILENQGYFVINAGGIGEYSGSLEK